ncbi:MAG TPA: EamA family transporter [Candidatus Acidoferrum sp.]|nr:EamA family transporter [Candidatus Acidoferrum sp.]
MPLWLLFALGAAILWSFGALFSKKGFTNISPLWNNVLANVIGLVLWLPIALAGTHFHIGDATDGSIVLIFITAFCYMSYFYAISKGKLALTGTVLETYPAVTVLLSFLFLHERIAAAQAAGIGVALIGTVLIALPPKSEFADVTDHHVWVLWGLAGAFLEGIGDFFAKVTVNTLGVYTQMFYLVVVFQFATIVNYMFDKKGRALPAFSWRAFLPSIVGISCIVAGTGSLFFAFQYGPASLVTPVTASSPALIVILAVIFLRERITRRQFMGILCVLSGVLLISLGGY